jgi:hypothetical protein
MRRKELKLESPYREELTDILSFSRFEDTESTLYRLDRLRLKYKSANDSKGVGYCRRIALLGRQRAALIQKNLKVNLSNRLRKQEIARWFEIWLETPDIFGSWLEMRKSTPEFQALLQSEAEDVKKS